MTDSVFSHNLMKFGTGIRSQNGKLCCMLVTKLPRYHSNVVSPANLVAIFVATIVTRHPRHQICKEKKMEKNFKEPHHYMAFGVSFHTQDDRKVHKKIQRGGRCHGDGSLHYGLGYFFFYLIERPGLKVYNAG